MANRKILGTILGIIMFTFCLIYFTYAYYTWQSEETPIGFSIEDIVIEFETGSDVNVNNIGPILDYNDGVSTEFNAINDTKINVPVKINLDITSISENLKTKDFKWILLRDDNGGTNYTKKVTSGNFNSFDEGSNRITDCEIVPANSKYSYKFIVYIDGNENNDINMQNNRLESNLVFEDSKVSYMTTFASNTDESYFKNDTYRESIKNVYFVDYIDTEEVVASWDMTDLENDEEASVMSWVVTNETDSNYYDLYIGSDDLIVGTDFSWLFSGLTNVDSITFNNFDTNISTSMEGMFGNCSSLTSLDLSNFNTSNVIDMSMMFYNCNNLTTTITIKNVSTSSYDDMFEEAATEENSQITVNYTSTTSSLVDSMINTKSTNSNVLKGSLA